MCAGLSLQWVLSSQWHVLYLRRMAKIDSRRPRLETRPVYVGAGDGLLGLYWVGAARADPHWHLFVAWPRAYIHSRRFWPADRLHLRHAGTLSAS